MRVDRQGENIRIEVTAGELRLLRRALERALFIDVPPAEMPEIAAFCAGALETLPVPGNMP